MLLRVVVTSDLTEELGHLLGVGRVQGLREQRVQ